MGYKPLKLWQGILKGKDPVFILGNAPSLIDNDLSLLDPYLTIGINRIFHHYEPTIIFWQDRSVWATSSRGIRETDSIKVTRKGMVNPALFPNYLFFELQGSRGTPYPKKCRTHKLQGKGITHGVATQFAEAIGPSHIIFLGIDCKDRKNQTNSYGINKFKSQDMLLKCKEMSEKIAKSCKTPIYNCGETVCWRRQSLGSVIKKINPPKHDKGYWKRFFEGTIDV